MFLLLCFPVCLMAQEAGDKPLNGGPGSISAKPVVDQPAAVGQSLGVGRSIDGARLVNADGYNSGRGTLEADSFALEMPKPYAPSMWLSTVPLWRSGFCSWRLHKGLNVSLNASVFASFGKKPFRGAGFAESVDAMYALPLSDRLSLALGGYIGSVHFRGDTFHDAGLTAVLGYKFSERLEGSVFAEKSLMDKRMPMPLCYDNNVGERIGAALEYHFTPSFSVNVSVGYQKSKPFVIENRQRDNANTNYKH